MFFSDGILARGEGGRSDLLHIIYIRLLATPPREDRAMGGWGWGGGQKETEHDAAICPVAH